MPVLAGHHRDVAPRGADLVIRQKRTFVMYADRHHDDRVAFWCALQPGARDMYWNVIAEVTGDAYHTVAGRGR